jgi:hypothetical protein
MIVLWISTEMSAVFMRTRLLAAQATKAGTSLMKLIGISS